MCGVTNPPEENNETNEAMESTDNSLDEDSNEAEDVDDEDDDDLTFEELQAIDNKLDELNLALDAMESKRDQIHEQLIELLESSREIRKEIQEEHVMNTDP